MPPIDPVAVRARAALIADKFYDFPACALAIRALLSDYADRSHRASEKVAGAAPANAYKTPQPVLRMLISALRDVARVSPLATLDLLKHVWKGGSREERGIAAELLGLVAPVAPEQALTLVEKWLLEIESADTAETLAEQGLGPLARANPAEHLRNVQRWMTRPQKWTRCFALATLGPLAKDKHWDDVPGALGVVRSAMDDVEPEIRRAAAALLSDLVAKSPVEVNLFLREQASRTNHNTHLIIRSVLPKLAPEDQAELVRRMRA